MTTRKYKDLKGLTKENLRDNMCTTELILNMLLKHLLKIFQKRNNLKDFPRVWKLQSAVVMLLKLIDRL